MGGEVFITVKTLTLQAIFWKLWYNWSYSYHDFIWDLGGTLLDSGTPHKAFVARPYSISKGEADHDSVYAAKVSTDYAVQQFASNLRTFWEV